MFSEPFPAAKQQQKKQPLDFNRRAAAYGYFYKDLIQHHSKNGKKQSIFFPGIIIQ
ncbi:hypothetical protein [Paenibacillus tianjinensis]|uniref:Uncharacterized protein n=1 Tax=Paenibacillus tianjinensis TaxID=2810347 RepID=A0ABX7L724_9BACL|nr:hypothetical protein [Paenibacillus tianjinensis]QSF43128.1 hypothetical protein JRJ22_17775 [Paenibacillus tianjinensis]